MEIMMRNILCLAVMVLLPFVRCGCQEDMMKDEQFMPCVMSFMQYFTDTGSGGMDMSNPKGIFDVICNGEGKQAFSCMLDYLLKCPEVMNAGGMGGENPLDSLKNISGIDMEKFMKKGGVDAVCAMMVGPCSEVQKCIPESQPGIVKRATSINYYMLFQAQSTIICGTMKEQMMCMINALDKCPDSIVDLVEQQFEKGLEMSMPDAYGVVSYQDTKTFITKECTTMQKFFGEQDTCVKGALMSKNFTECTQTVSEKYSEARNCEVYGSSKQCVMDTVEPQCGEEAAMFLTRNAHVIFPGIPNDCENKDTSGSDMQQTTFGMLLFSILISVIYFL